ncbi:hypothetical protein Mp_6g15010 [Marchantia polymorpha subsp. ruderalis]|uniref:Uncharacterized protein n=2 Tax=Marchantia polymorpha TaxID=3197 RepID=A0AAF6BS67_MARPO|nr:hypothetical protein MARPO_0056s0011 [Marchantia polymorpha]BBN14851.1 hypothetical protein Mp_6g15010 [Marchantia polymorpha subsp. ruderalis]|eukprot:PTQ37532.1 hypothetical protein MARPO_0056s0011 [Marchantia polymorpha]
MLSACVGSRSSPGRTHPVWDRHTRALRYLPGTGRTPLGKACPIMSAERRCSRRCPTFALSAEYREFLPMCIFGVPRLFLSFLDDESRGDDGRTTNRPLGFTTPRGKVWSYLFSV